MSENYDRLSEKGIAQAGMLGSWMKQEGIQFDACFHGTLERQRDSYGHFKQAYGADLPHPEISAAFNEHEGTEVFKMYREKAPAIADKKEALRFFFRMNMKWIAGEIDSGPHEAWAGFMNRTQTGFQSVFDQLNTDKQVAIFTSGGVIARGIGLALELSGQKIMELNWQILNASVSVISYHKGRLFLRSFNDVQHLPKDMITSV